MAILYVASEAAELKPLAEMLTGLRKLSWPIDYAYEGIQEGRRILLAANGAGPRLAEKAVEVAIRAVTAADLSASKLEAVVSTGWCGALEPSLKEKQILIATEILNPASRERYECVGVNVSDAVGKPFVSGAIVSQDRIAATAKEKNSLRAESGALAVEMEAAGVAARAKRAGLPFCCIKVVADRAEESFVFDLNAMRTSEGRIARGKIIVHTVAHLNLLPELFRLKRRSEEAAQALGEFLVSCRISIVGSSLLVE
jgi:adenosylhomocysteine nucleosidase